MLIHSHVEYTCNIHPTVHFPICYLLINSHAICVVDHIIMVTIDSDVASNLVANSPKL